MDKYLKMLPEIPPRLLARAWIMLVAITVWVFFVISRITDITIDALLMWFFSCIILYYQSRKERVSRFVPAQQVVTIFLGACFCVLSAFNIQLGFGNPPYSIGDYSILLSGIGLVIIGLYNIRSFMVPIILPGIMTLGYQVYELALRNEQILSAPLIPPTVFFSKSVIQILGIPITSQSNMLILTAKTGGIVRLLVLPECTGLWSLGTYTAIVLMVLFTFPEVFSRRGALLIFIGYLGTYVGNILRISAISVSGYLFGPTGAVEDTHLYFGWIIFLLWMTLFWYYFFTRFIRLSLKSKAPDPAEGTK